MRYWHSWHYAMAAMAAVKLHCVLVRCGRDVCMTLVENRAVDLFFTSDLAYCSISRRVRYIFLLI